VKFEDGKVYLPSIGYVRLKEQPRFKGRVVSSTVKADADRWTLTVLFDVPDRQYHLGHTGDRTIGVDVGLNSFATFSDGTKVEAPKPLKKNLKRLRRRQRTLSRRQKGSNRRKRAKLSVARLHRRIRNVRKDFLHTLTTKIVRENQTIAIEDLNVKGMLKNDKLSRAISDVGWFEFRRQLTYKSVLHGRTLFVADRFFPSSKKCSRCGLKKVDLTLADRTFVCPFCRHTEDRDVNAAKNLRTLAQRGTNARGELQALVLDGIIKHQPTRRNVNPGARKRAKKDQGILSPIPGV
jgi:putative transposase